MTPKSRKPARVAIVWLAPDPAPRGWNAWLTRLLGGYLSDLDYPDAGITLLVADDAILKSLNATHRGRNRPTDILSFSYLEVPKKSAMPPGKRPHKPFPDVLGELAVSWPRAVDQANANGWDTRTEIARLLAHGCVHLLGYDHSTRRDDAVMRRIEERLLERAGFRGLYPDGRSSLKIQDGPNRPTKSPSRTRRVGLG